MSELPLSLSSQEVSAQRVKVLETDLRNFITPQMDKVNQLIRENLYSEVVLVRQISEYIINNGGKRLRPILVLLSAGALGYSEAQGNAHYLLSAIIEFIHTATLLHDDVVDESDMRRGKKTANNVFGNPASVLVGDFLYSRSFQMMVSIKNMRVMEILSDATNVIAEGEVLQLMNCNDPDVSEERYMQVIYYKTAKLFEAASCLGAVIAQSSAEQEQAMVSYGIHLGAAFQLIDDILDYSGNAETIGKNLGDDLAEGKPTLPLIFVMKNGDQNQVNLIREAIEQGSADRFTEIVEAIHSSGAIKYTHQKAIEEASKARQAIEIIHDSEYKTLLNNLTYLAVERVK